MPLSLLRCNDTQLKAPSFVRVDLLTKYLLVPKQYILCLVGLALGQYHFWVQCVVAFCDRFIGRTTEHRIWSCVRCPIPSMTIQEGVSKRLKEEMPDIRNIVVVHYVPHNPRPRNWLQDTDLTSGIIDLIIKNTVFCQ